MAIRIQEETSPSTGTTVPTTTTVPGFTPEVPVGDAGTDSEPSGPYSLPSTFEWESRTVSLPKAKLGNAPGYDVQFFGSTSKTVYDYGYTATGKEDWVYNAQYVGPNLVDATGQIARSQYDPTQDAWPIIASYGSETERAAFLSNLYSKGFYSYGQPSQWGTSDADMNAVQQFLMLANKWGYTADVTLSLVNQRFPNARPSSTGAGGRAIQYTPAKDLEAVMRSVSQQMLGRNVDDEDLKRFVDAYHTAERAAQRGGSTQGTTSADVAAESQLKEQYGAEASAVGFMNLAAVMESLIKGQ